MATRSNSNRPPQPVSGVLAPPDFLQWNCRSLGQCAAELAEVLHCIGKLAALLQQETSGDRLGLSGYTSSFQPTVEHRHARDPPKPRFSYGKACHKHRLT